MRIHVGIIAAAAPPTLVSATIASNGTTLTLVFSEAVTGREGFSLTASGGYVVPTYVSGDGSNTYAYSLSRTIESGETVTLDYTL